MKNTMLKTAAVVVGGLWVVGFAGLVGWAVSPLAGVVVGVVFAGAMVTHLVNEM